MNYNINIRKKDNGYQAIVQYKDKNKWKQKSKQGFESTRMGKRAAQDWAAKTVEELKGLNLDDEELKDITFGEFTTIHIKHLSKHSSLGSIRNFETVVKKFDRLNNKYISDIKTIDIQNIVDDLLDELAVTTIKDYLGKLSLFFKDAIEKYNLITVNPVDKITIKVKHEKQDMIVFSNKESIELLSKLKGEYYYIALIALKAGLRIGEIVGLTWQDIDFVNKKIIVNKQWKELAKNEYGFGALKSKNSNRVVPMPGILVKELKQLKKNSVIQIDNRLFSYKNTASITAMMKTKFNRIGYDISIHNLRHTYATNLIASGLDYRTAAMLLGHTVEMTMKTYSHVNSDMLDRASRIINENF